MILFRLFYEFFIISSFAIGGGYAMIPLIKEQVVKLGFLTVNQINDIIAISEMTPGPFAVNSATFAGVKTAGVLGGIFSTLGVSLPALIYAVLVAKFYFKLKGNQTFENILRAIRPASVALICLAIISLLVSAVDNSFLWFRYDIAAVFIAILTFVLIKKFKVSPVICLLISGVLGVLIYSL